VVTDDLGHVWAGDGAGDIIEADASKPGTEIIRKIPTGGKFRVDEMAYDSKDKILMTSNDGDMPPFLTFISVTDGKVLGHYKYPAGQDGMEQPVWDAETGWFYQNVPGKNNRIDVFAPHHLPRPIKSFPVECKGGALDLTLSGLTVGPNGRLMTVCGSVGGLGLDARTGKPGKPIPQVGDTDEVWYDPATNNYYFAHGVIETIAGAPKGALGIVNAATEQFVREIPFTGSGVHSVAVNPRNKHIFVPVNGKGIYVVVLGQ
jgi:hypothetical protein